MFGCERRDRLKDAAVPSIDGGGQIEGTRATGAVPVTGRPCIPTKAAAREHFRPAHSERSRTERIEQSTDPCSTAQDSIGRLLHLKDEPQVLTQDRSGSILYVAASTEVTLSSSFHAAPYCMGGRNELSSTFSCLEIFSPGLRCFNKMVSFLNS